MYEVILQCVYIKLTLVHYGMDSVLLKYHCIVKKVKKPLSCKGKEKAKKKKKKKKMICQILSVKIYFSCIFIKRMKGLCPSEITSNTK